MSSRTSVPARAYVCPNCHRTDDEPRTAEALDEVRQALGLLAAATPQQIAYHVKCKVIDNLENHRKYVQQWLEVGEVEKRIREELDQYDEPGTPKLAALVESLLEERKGIKKVIACLQEYVHSDKAGEEAALLRLQEACAAADIS